jgi:flagellar capping protein FliD
VVAKGHFEALGYRIDRLETRLDGRIDTLETRLDGRIDGLEGRFDTLQSSLDGLRSDLTQVALAVGVHPRVPHD